MQKIIALLLSLIILVDNPVFAEALITQVEKTQAPTSSSSPVEISKTPVSLKSYLKHEGNAYLYTLKNNASTPILLTNIYGQKDLKKAFRKEKTRRAESIITRWQMLGMSPIALGLGIITLPLTPVIALDALNSSAEKDCVGMSSRGVMTAISLMPIAGIIFGVGYPVYVVASTPYTIVKGSIEDIQATVEAKKVNHYKLPLTIKSGEEIKLVIIEPYREKAIFEVSEPATQNKYTLQK